MPLVTVTASERFPVPKLTPAAMPSGKWCIAMAATNKSACRHASSLPFVMPMPPASRGPTMFMPLKKNAHYACRRARQRVLDCRRFILEQKAYHSADKAAKCNSCRRNKYISHIIPPIAVDAFYAALEKL